MGTIQSSLQLYDGVSNTLRNIDNAMNTTVNTFYDMQSACETSFDSSRIEMTRNEIDSTRMSIEQMEPGISRNTDMQNNFNNSIGNGTNQANRLQKALMSVVSVYTGMRLARGARNYIMDSTEAIQTQIQTETKLQTIMAQRMNATDTEINQIKSLASAQQNLGVIGDEVQLAGAQQLSTFLNTSGALGTLIPAMNNLAAQQNGVSNTAESMTNIGNLMGKAMQGQVGALTRVGITFNEAQEQILKYGTEQERAAILAQVITDNVGEMNAVLAQTPQGQIQQMKNDFGDMQENVGKRLEPALMKLFATIRSRMPQIEKLMYAVADALSFIIIVIGEIIDIASRLYDFVQEHWTLIAPIITGVAVAMLAYKAATMAASIAQGILNLAMLACPLTWIIVGIVAIIAIIYAVVKAMNYWKDETYSTTGSIAGFFGVMGAGIANVFISVYNVISGIITEAWNLVADFANFFGNVFDSPGKSIMRMLFGISDSVYGVFQVAASGIDALVGTSLSSKMQGFWDANTASRDSYWGKPENEVMQKRRQSDYQKERVDPMKWWNSAYSAGEGFEQHIQETFSSDNITNKMNDYMNDVLSTLDKVADNTGEISEDVSNMTVDVDAIRNWAEREAINQFTTAEVKVVMNNENKITSNVDVDGLFNEFTDKLQQSLVISAEGVHA